MYLSPAEGDVKGTGSRLSACSWINLLFPIYYLFYPVNNPTHMYLSDLRVYFKVQVYLRVTKKDGGVLKSHTKKLVDYANTTNVDFIVDRKALFHGWLIYSYLQICKLIKCKWMPGECADWFFENIMTWSYCLHRRYSTSRQKNSILINEHALNREPVPLNIKIGFSRSPWPGVCNCHKFVQRRFYNVNLFLHKPFGRNSTVRGDVHMGSRF